MKSQTHSQSETESDIVIHMKKQESNHPSLFKNLRNARNVELCFLLDCTGSMGPYIQGSKEAIEQIVDYLTTPDKTTSQKGQASNLRFSLVAYRDFGDNPGLEVHPFNPSVEKFKEFCGNLQASGGGDLPEDVHGGLEAALKLEWSENYATKVIFHIADAPCHGTKYHDNIIGDTHPDFDSDGKLTLKLFTELRNRNIQYHFGRILSDTDPMIQQFAKVYNRGIDNFDISDVKNIHSCVVAAVNKSVITTIYFAQRYLEDEISWENLEFDKNEPNWSEVSNIEGQYFTYFASPRIEDILDGSNIQEIPKSALCKIASKPYAKIGNMLAYYGKDQGCFGQNDVVFKEVLTPHFDYKSCGESFAIAQVFVEKFAEKSSHNLNLANTKIFKFKTACYEKPLICEPRFGKNARIVRFVNFGDFWMTKEMARDTGVDPMDIQKMAAFSHFTYQETNGYLLVHFLQGVVNRDENGQKQLYLTSPVIHSIDFLKFGPNNGGEDGINLFFDRHLCNSFCEELGLKVKTEDDQPEK